MANIDISQYLKQDYVSLDVQAKTSQGVIKELAERIYNRTGMASYSASEKTACAEVINREKMQSTGTGNGLAFPLFTSSDIDSFL